MDFSQVKLKKVQVEEKTTKDNFMEQYFKGIHSTFMDVYYESIKEFTFKTIFVPLTVTHAKTVIQAHQRCKGTVELTIEEKESLKDLIEPIQSGIDTFGAVFVKLSSRSPKDVQSKKVEKLIDEEFALLNEDQLKDNNHRIFAVQKAAMKALKITSIEQVFEILVLSQRVYEDFEEELLQKKFNISLIIREWKDIDIDMEFRAFVYDGKIAAISQYNFLCFFPHIVEKKDLIAKRIFEMYELIKPSVEKFISNQRCIVDFYVKKDLENYKEAKDCVGIIELNPYELTTGACLFSWKNDQDLLQGKKDFEFRIVEKKVEDFSKTILPEYESYYRLLK